MIVVQSREPNHLKEQLQERFQGPISVLNGAVRLEHSRGHELIRDLMDEFPDEIQAISLGKPTLEDVFVHETGRDFHSLPDASRR